MTITGPSRSLKVTDFATAQKPVCDLLLVNNTNMSYHAPFLSYCAVLIKLLLYIRVPLFNSLIRDDPLHSGLQNLVSKN